MAADAASATTGPRSPTNRGPTSPVRTRSPTAAAAPYGPDGLDGSAGGARKYNDYRMESAPIWDGERPESEYREYARKLKLWLIEARERLPSSLIGKRILDAIPYSSRLSSVVAHLSVEDITAENGWKEVVKCIEEARDYLKVAKLEQAFNAAIFGGRRKPGQTITGYLATKKAAFAELRKQGLDLLETEAGQHLLGHLVMRQGGFSQDEQQRIRVLTDGSVDFRKVELAIRKVFADSIDDSGLYKGRSSYWGEFGEPSEEDFYDYGDQSSYGDQIYYGHSLYPDDPDFTVDLDPFEDLLEVDDGGSVFLCLDEPLPQMLDEDEAVAYTGELLSYVFGEVGGRWNAKGKGKGKFKGKGKGKAKGKERGSSSGKGFGIYGTYADHRRALQEARTSRGFGNGKGHGGDHHRPRASLQEIQNRSRCHNCRQLGHWSKDCPQRRRAPVPPSPRGTSSTGSQPGGRSGPPSTNLFFVGSPSWNQDDNGSEFWCASGGNDVSGFTGFSMDSSQMSEPGVPASAPPIPAQSSLVKESFSEEQFANQSEYMLTFLSFTFASCETEPSGTALVDTAAQHGLIGSDTLARHDQYLQERFHLRVQYSDEQGGTVRGVCGSEEVTRVAYIPIGLGGRCGILRVQVVPGWVPCLIPAYFLEQQGAVIDMSGLMIAYTRLSVVQSMNRRSSGHVAVSLCEFGQGWYVPATYDFLKSEIWKVKGPFLKPSSELCVSLLDGNQQEIPMPSAVEAVRLALVLCAGYAGARCLRDNHDAAPASSSSTFGTATRSLRKEGAAAAAARTSALGGSWRTSELSASPTCSSSRRSYRATASQGGAPWQEQVLDAGPAVGSQLQSRGNQAWLQLGMGMDKMCSMQCGGTSSEDGPRRDEQVELDNDLPAAELQDAHREEARESFRAREEEGPTARDSYAEFRDELLDATCAYGSDVSSFGQPRQSNGCGPNTGPDGHCHPRLQRAPHLRDRCGRAGPLVTGGGRDGDARSVTEVQDVPWTGAPDEEGRSVRLGLPGRLDYVSPQVAGQQHASSDGCASVSGMPENLVPNVRRPDPGGGMAASDARIRGERWLSDPSCESGVVGDSRANVMIGWLGDQGVQDQLGNVSEILGLVKPHNSVAHWCYGRYVPGKAPVRSRSFFGTRLVATCPQPGRWNIVDIDNGGLHDYDLGMEMNALVIQEFTEDSITYLNEMEHDGYEVTLDKAAKKQLSEALDRSLGVSLNYFELWEEGLSSSEEEAECFGSLVLATRRSREHPGNPTAPLIRRPVPTPSVDELNLGMSQRKEILSQRRFLPQDVDCQVLLDDIEKFGNGVRHLWKDYYGQAMYISLKPAQALLPQVGPGHRTSRWTVVKVGFKDWRWLEKGATGKWHPEARKHQAVIVLYYWPESPDSSTYVASYDLTDREKAEVLRCHTNLGHPNNREFIRVLKSAGTRHDILQYVAREFQCPGCVQEKRPPTRLPSATPRVYDFNVILGVDVLFVHGASHRAEHPVLNITCLGTLYSTFGVIDARKRSSELTWKAFMTLWLRVFGPPACVLFDEGNEFVGKTFQEGLEQHGIRPIEINRQSPFELGTVERRGGMFKEAYYRSRELRQPLDFAETEMLIYEVSWAIQTLTNRSGYSPAQRVFGRQPRTTLDALSDGGEFELSPTTDSAWQRAHEFRMAARKALIELDAKARVRRAKLARPRQEINKLQFDEGEPVLVWKLGRRGSTAKVGPCWVILQNGHTVWVTRRGELWKCHVAQVFKMSNADKDGLEAVPEEFLQAKARLKYDSEKLMFKDVSQELDLVDDEVSAVKDEILSEGEPGKYDGDGRGPEVSTEIPVPDPQAPPGGGVGPVLDGGREPEVSAEIPVPDPVVPIIIESSSSSGGSSSTSSSSSSGGSSGVPSGAMTPESSSSSSTSTTPRAPSGQAEWPPAGSGTILKKWVRYDRSANRYRTSNSQGPMWSDVVQRITVDNETGRVIKREDIRGNEASRDLHKPLPKKLKSVKTVLVYKKVSGHPDPGVPLSDPDRPELDDEPVPEDARLIDKRVKRTLDDPAGEEGSAPQRSKVFGAWMADAQTEFGDRSKHAAIANARDLKLFSRVLERDMVFEHAQIYGSHVYLTKKSGKELNEKNFSRQEQELFNEAKLKEINTLEQGNSIRFITDPDEVKRIRQDLGHRIMPSRFVLTKKSQELGETWKAKARWILLGHRDPDALEVERFSPTPSGPTVHLAFQLIASQRFGLEIMDVTSAFGQSDAEVRKQGPLYASMPTTGIPGKEQWMLVEILTAIYGLVNAPATWRRTVRKVLLSLGYSESIYDPCLFILHYNAEERAQGASFGCAGLVLLDVDDFAQGGGARHKQLMLKLKERFRFGKWRVVYKSYAEYLGRTVRQLENFEIRIDMQRYIEEKLHAVRLPRARVSMGDEEELTDPEVTMLRGAGGSLLWVGKEARPDVAGACSMAMSWGSGRPCIKHIKGVNKTIAELKKTSDCYLRIMPIALSEGMWLAVSDASVANDSEKSQGGFVVAFAEKGIKDGKLAMFSINCWRSHRLKRVVKASLGSEALAMDDGLAELEWLRAMFAESCVANSTVCDGSRFGPGLDSIMIVRQQDDAESILVTDARALYDLFHRRSGAAGLCRRAQIDVAVLAASAQTLQALVYWIPGTFMLADCLTKRVGNASLMRRVMLLGLYALHLWPLKTLLESDSDAPPGGCETCLKLPESVSS